MAIYKFFKPKAISVAVPLNNGNIIPIYTNAPPYDNLTQYDADIKIFAVNGSINSLSAYVKMDSINSSGFPNIDVTDTEAEKLTKIAELEWRSPRKLLSIYVGKAGNYNKITTLSLMNLGGYPFRNYDLIDYLKKITLGTGDSIGISIENAGYGYLTGDDSVNIFGSVLEEYNIYVKESVVISGGGSGGTTPPPTPTELDWTNLTEQQWLNLTNQQWLNL